MIRADENMPEMTDDELVEWQERMRWQEYEVPNTDAAEALYEARRVLHPHADPRCKWCHGTGTVYDTVDYGSTTVQMPSTCECVEGDAITTSTLDRLLRIHRVNLTTERRMNKLLRICVMAETPEMRRQYTNAYAHMIAVRNIRHRVANGEA